MGGEDDVFAFSDRHALEPAAIFGLIPTTSERKAIGAALVEYDARLWGDFVADGIELPAVDGGLISECSGRAELKNRENCQQRSHKASHTTHGPRRGKIRQVTRSLPHLLAGIVGVCACNVRAAAPLD